jgi:glycosyltransferase involved in cell wall biosynthesis
MRRPLVTLGVPVFRGQEDLPQTLECLRTQTYDNLEILVSVDGGDIASAEAAHPFLSDSRFRLVVQSERLGWAGNSDWTIQNRRGEYYLYQQHDDDVSPTYIADLLAYAEQHPSAVICYAEMELAGLVEGRVRHEPILGDPLTRALTFIERLDSSAFRGMIRGGALDKTSGLQVTDYESFDSFYLLMTELALLGEFHFVEGPTYYRRLHGDNLHLKWYNWSPEQKRAAWAMLAAHLLEIVVPLGATMSERRHIFDTVVERFAVPREGRHMFPNLSKPEARLDMIESICRRLRCGKLQEADVGASWDELERWAAGNFAPAG